MTGVRKLLVFWLACYFLSSFSSIHAKCLNDQRSYLLQFRNAVIYDPVDFLYTPFNWNKSMDCCKWEGVVCDYVGHVISLDLDFIKIDTGKNEDWKSIFKLQYLEELRLFGSSFGGIAIPVELFNLTRIKLTSLVTLQLSYVQGRMELKNPGVLFQNLTQLKELDLDGVDISAGGNAWCNVLSSLSKLQVLSLQDCQLSGPILPSLSNLSSLTTIQLDYNPLNTTILFNLTVPGTDLLGQFPQKILQIPTLESLDLSVNDFTNFQFIAGLHYLP